MRQPRSDVARNRRLLVEAAIESFQELGWDVPLDTGGPARGGRQRDALPSLPHPRRPARSEIHERLVAVLARYFAGAVLALFLPSGKPVRGSSAAMAH